MINHVINHDKIVQDYLIMIMHHDDAYCGVVLFSLLSTPNVASDCGPADERAAALRMSPMQLINIPLHFA